MRSIPLARLPGDVAERVAALGTHRVNLYHAPGWLRAWMYFAWLPLGAAAALDGLRRHG